MSLSISNFQRAEVLTQALPYICRHANKVVVVKYGGNAMINGELKQQVMEDLVLLSLVGVKVVLVHGGGPEITVMLDRFGKKSVFHNGLRVTDRETVGVVQMVLAGKINKELVKLLQLRGGKAAGISGIDGRLLKATMRDEKLGFVGDITDVNPQLVLDLLAMGYIPVISTIGCDDKGNTFNINADTAAAWIAGGVGAERLISISDIPGVLRDCDDPSSLISCMDIQEAEELFHEGIISGGMIPKVECCIEAIKRGVNRVVIVDGRVPHAILTELLTSEGAGTMVVEAK